MYVWFGVLTVITMKDTVFNLNSKLQKLLWCVSYCAGFTLINSSWSTTARLFPSSHSLSRCSAYLDIVVTGAESNWQKAVRTVQAKARTTGIKSWDATVWPNVLFPYTITLHESQYNWTVVLKFGYQLPVST